MALFFLLLGFFVVNSSGADVVSTLPANMDFETEFTDSLLFNWDCIEDGYQFVCDSTVSLSGSRSGRLDFVGPEGEAGLLTQKIPYSYQGDEIVFSGFFRKSLLGDESSSGFFMRLFGSAGEFIEHNYSVIEDSTGDSDWAHFEIMVESGKFADSLSFGVYLIGSGSIWIDDLEMTIDGNPVAETPLLPEYGALTDHEFDAGSGIAINEVDSFQIESLVQLGKIWAFLKYHHPYICNGEVNWDYQLFRVMPGILQASTSREREQALLGLFDDLPLVVSCKCTDIEVDRVRLATDLSWIDNSVLGVTLTEKLENVYAGRYQEPSFYVRSTPYPFFFENSYEDLTMPDAGFRILALYRYWGMVEYYFPYRYATNNSWSDQIRISLPYFIAADSPLEYQQALQRLIVSVGDSHARLFTESETLTEFLGEYSVPLHLCCIDGNWVVDGYTHSSGEESSVRVGDVVLSCDGELLSDIVERLRPYSSGSNEQSMFHIMGRYLLRVDSDSVQLVMSRGDQTMDVTMTAVPAEEVDRSYSEVPAVGETSYTITDENVGYVHLGTLMRSDVPGMKEAFREISGLVLDLRSYPCDFPIYEVASYIVPESTPFVIFSKCDFSNPGTFYWNKPTLAGGDDSEMYTGRVALIVDEGTQSSGEFHAMAWRVAPETMVFGHATAGADGNVVSFYLPGGMYSRFTGLGVYNPDSSETQRVGIIPDVPMSPTIPGLQAGRDELLEAAVEWVLSIDNS